MAALVLYIRYGFKPKDDTFTISASDKFHLARPPLSLDKGRSRIVSVCNDVIISEIDLINEVNDERWETRHILDIDPKDFCTDCLGPMRALSNDSGY